MCLDRTTQALYVPIDVGKNVHSYAAYVGPYLKQIIPPRETRTHRPSYERFKAWLTELVQSQQYDPIILGIEPTGVYHEPWAYALQRDFGPPVTLHIVNPFRTRQKRKQLQNRAERKTDPIDNEALAHCLRDGLGRPFSMPSADIQALDLCCRRYDILKRDRQRLTQRLRTLLDRLWPGALVDVKKFQNAHPDLDLPVPLVRTRPFERELVHTVLKLDANPYVWQALSVAQIQDRLRKTGIRCGPVTAQRIWQVAHHALLPPVDLAQQLAHQVQEDLQRFQRLSQNLAQLKARAEALVRRSPGAVVATVPGIGDFLAAQYVGLVADIQRFDHADQVWALAGFDIVQENSGDQRRRGHLTKRGRPYARAVLYRMGLNASSACPAVRRAKQRARQRGKSKVIANIHAAHKTNRICFHLYRHGIPFDPSQSR